VSSQAIHPSQYSPLQLTGKRRAACVGLCGQYSHLWTPPLESREARELAARTRLGSIDFAVRAADAVEKTMSKAIKFGTSGWRAIVPKSLRLQYPAGVAGLPLM